MVRPTDDAASRQLAGARAAIEQLQVQQRVLTRTVLCLHEILTGSDGFDSVEGPDGETFIALDVDRFEQIAETLMLQVVPQELRDDAAGEEASGEVKVVVAVRKRPDTNGVAVPVRPRIVAP